VTRTRLTSAPLALGMVCALSQATETSIPVVSNSATLGGVTLLEPFENVSARLGNPRQVIRDDGAAFGTQYVYEGMTIWAGFDDKRKVIVQQIVATSARYCTPSGVCPGRKVSDIRSKLGKPYLTGSVVEGRNRFPINVEACWLEADILEGVIQQLAIKCQP
jgi:hypothetical protein